MYVRSGSVWLAHDCQRAVSKDMEVERDVRSMRPLKRMEGGGGGKSRGGGLARLVCVVREGGPLGEGKAPRPL